jgi:hypothetical protein
VLIKLVLQNYSHFLHGVKAVLVSIHINYM